MRVMGYNIMNGGGIQHKLARISSKSGYPGNRLNSITDVISQCSPDLLVLVEANGWQRWHTRQVKRFAQSIGHQGQLFPSMSGHHIVTLSHIDMTHHIAFKKNDAIRRCAGYVKLSTLDHDLHVFVAHLYPNPLETTLKDAEVEFLLAEMNKIDSARVLLIGDMNWPPGFDRWENRVKDDGWKTIARSAGGRWDVDYIWGSAELAKSATPICPLNDLKIDKALLDRASDHYPVIADFRLPISGFAASHPRAEARG